LAGDDFEHWPVIRPDTREQFLPFSIARRAGGCPSWLLPS
jgi:hypothetical protein